MVCKINDLRFSKRFQFAAIPSLSVQKSNTCFFASLFVPGLGQLMRRKYFLGAACFILAVVAWMPPFYFWPIILLHSIAALNAGRRDLP